MLSGLSAGRIWLCTQPTDMRCSFDGLSARVRRYLGEDPTSGQWFVFINRRRNQTTFYISISVRDCRVSMAPALS